MRRQEKKCKPETTILFKVLRFKSNAPLSVLRSQEIVMFSPITAEVAFSGLLVKKVRRDFNLSLPCVVSSTKIQPRKQAPSRMPARVGPIKRQSVGSWREQLGDSQPRARTPLRSSCWSSAARLVSFRKPCPPTWATYPQATESSASALFSSAVINS